MKITAGSLTTAMNALVNKKYVLRERGEKDRRVVYIWLTERGSGLTGIMQSFMNR